MGVHRRVARTEDENVTVKDAGGVDLAVCDYVCGPCEALHRQESVRGSSGGEFGVRGRGEEPGLVISVERLSIESGYAYPKVGVLEGGIGKDGLNALDDGALGRSRVLRTRCRGVSGATLGSENCRRDEGQRQKQRERSRCTEHGGSLAGARMVVCALRMRRSVESAAPDGMAGLFA